MLRDKRNGAKNDYNFEQREEFSDTFRLLEAISFLHHVKGIRKWSKFTLVGRTEAMHLFSCDFLKFLLLDTFTLASHQMYMHR